jgi:hypothetical protein
MERQAGLGRSLEQVLDSLTPAEPDASAAGRVLFEPEDIEQQLDQLMSDIRDLRERVQHLVGMVPAGVVLEGAPALEPRGAKAPKTNKKKRKKKLKKNAKKARQMEHGAERNGSASRQTK